MIRTALRSLAGALVLAGSVAATAWSALPAGFADQLLVTDLSQPSGFAFLPDGRLLILEQKTRLVRLAPAGGGPADTTLLVPGVNIAGGEQGLLGIAVDPAWPARPHVYLYFDATPGGVAVIARYTASGVLDDPDSSDLLLSARFDIMVDIPDANGNHNGGTLRFGPDGMLYASLGDDTDPCAAQDSTTLKGAILRLDVSALPASGSGPPAKSLITPADNPFVGGHPNAGLVWAYGLRNPFRFHIDPPSGRLYVADVGGLQYEEVDESSGGENFGWPNYEGPAEQGKSCGPSSPVTFPIAWYDRTGFTAAIISASIYRPLPGGIYNFPAEYQGDYFYVDYFEGFVRRLKNTAGEWAPAEPVPGQPNPPDWATAITRTSDWLTGADGGLYYCRQSPGSIGRIVYTGNQGGVEDPAGMRPGLAISPNPYHPGHGLLRIVLNGVSNEEVPCPVDVYDVAGRQMSVLMAERGGETVELTWNGSGRNGQPLASGLYFLKLRGHEEIPATRLVIPGE